VSDHPAVGSHQPATGRTPGTAAFDERLSVPWWWYVLAVGLAGLLGAEIHMGYPGVRSWIGYATFIPLFAAALFWLGRTRVRVAGGELAVGPASVPLGHVGHVDIVPRPGKQEAMGPQLDPAAYIMHRGWVGPLVRVEITDPQDPTPYWIFSCRRPEALQAALTQKAPDLEGPGLLT
jgi:Protein of unknown function (DUF3093)